jgi:hypothetical protein
MTQAMLLKCPFLLFNTAERRREGLISICFESCTHAILTSPNCYCHPLYHTPLCINKSIFPHYMPSQRRRSRSAIIRCSSAKRQTLAHHHQPHSPSKHFTQTSSAQPFHLLSTHCLCILALSTRKTVRQCRSHCAFQYESESFNPRPCDS